MKEIINQVEKPHIHACLTSFKMFMSSTEVKRMNEKGCRIEGKSKSSRTESIQFDILLFSLWPIGILCCLVWFGVSFQIEYIVEL